MSEPTEVPAFSATGLAVAALAVPAALLWDFAWESTVGIDLVLAPPHVALYLAIALAAGFALDLIRRGKGGRPAGLRGPLGAWIVLWGALAYGAAFAFDLWWQSLYGLAAGIWHPPQMLKAASFVAIGLGAWFCGRSRPWTGAVAAASLLAFACAAMLPNLLANRQHGAAFLHLACTIFPGLLALVAVGAGGRFAAARAALVAFGLGLLAVWLLPLLPGSPQVAPVYHPRDHLMPPPFPLLLFLPALALDLTLRGWGPTGRAGREGLRAFEGGLVFFGVFLAVQWHFAPFLLSPAAEGWFFAGGGKHWPFFLNLDDASRTSFWRLPGDEATPIVFVRCALMAMLSTRLGLWLGGRTKGGAT